MGICRICYREIKKVGSMWVHVQILNRNPHDAVQFVIRSHEDRLEAQLFDLDV